MKIDKKFRPELVVSKGKAFNPLLTDPYLDVKEDRLVATDGHCMVVLPVETDKGERSRYLACNLIKAARSFGDKSLPADTEAARAYVEENGGGPCQAISFDRNGICLRDEE